MNSTLKNMVLTLGLATIFFAELSYGQKRNWSVQDMELSTNWQIQTSAKINAGGQEISGTNFKTSTGILLLFPAASLVLSLQTAFLKIFFLIAILKKFLIASSKHPGGIAKHLMLRK